MAWAPDVSVDWLIADFCKTSFGLVGDVAKNVYTTLEAVVRNACKIPGTSLKTVAEYDAFINRIDSCRKLVKASGQKHSLTPMLAMNLKRLDLMLDYAARNIAIQRHAVLYGPEDEKRKMVDGLARLIDENKDEGVFMVHTRLTKPRLYAHFGLKIEQ